MSIVYIGFQLVCTFFAIQSIPFAPMSIQTNKQVCAFEWEKNLDQTCKSQIKTIFHTKRFIQMDPRCYNADFIELPSIIMKWLHIHFPAHLIGIHCTTAHLLKCAICTAKFIPVLEMILKGKQLLRCTNREY